jgi:hydrogenase maturation protein HypF
MGSSPGAAEPSGRERRQVHVTGVVQGVGFRPYVYALARSLGLSGAVWNSSAGVFCEVEGDRAAVAAFTERIGPESPPLAVVSAVTWQPQPVQGGLDFVIRDSVGEAGRTLVSPDVATCADCLADLADPVNRRHRHAFVTCTNCGPRFTIVTGLPYDRPFTTMADFPMCPACAGEYADPGDRRFHAQPVSCPDCGPRLRLVGASEVAVSDDAAVAAVRRLLREGAIVAIKGIGGYHLACDATDETAVATLRARKQRGDKPFAVMVRDLEAAGRIADLTPAESALLSGHHRPIVLVADRRDGPRLPLAPSVAPRLGETGLMLPYTPLHQLLFGLPGDDGGLTALVLTSGNLAGEPIVTEDDEAVERLAGLADAWLTHDRRIHVPCDDSVVRVVDELELPVRRSRGYAPLPIDLPFEAPPVLAVGGDLKNTFCLAEGRLAWLSAHVGDMDDLATQTAFSAAEQHLEMLTGVMPAHVVADRHPGYRTHRWARDNAGDRTLTLVQHHHAHVASTMAEHGLDGSHRVLGVAFDGTGYGDDGASWGGEFLLADYSGYERVGHLAYVPLPGGDAGVENPCRMALSHLRSAGIDWDERLPAVAACTPEELRLLDRQLETGFRTAPTSSMGRLFDAVSSLLGVCHRAGYEAQAAMELEALTRGVAADRRYAFALAPGTDAPGLLADPGPVLRAIVEDLLAGAAPASVAASFHVAIADVVAEIADDIRGTTGVATVALTGGVFVNARLTHECRAALTLRGLDVLVHRRVPPSDAGIALGQVAVLAHRRD